MTIAVVAVCLLVVQAVAAFPSPVYPSVWPLPQTFNSGSATSSVIPTTLSVDVQSACCAAAVQAAVTRALDNAAKGINSTTLPYLKIKLPPIVNVSTPQWPAPSAAFTSFKVDVLQSSQQSLETMMKDESYTLTLQATSGTLTANTLVGALRGLESFSQLIAWNGQQFIIPNLPIQIQDSPRFAWRGLLVDSARHFLPVETLKHIMDGMAAIKMNVFHWHVVDAQTFPIESKTYPLLSGAGALHPRLTYSQTQVKDLIQYAATLGIRVIPEFDVPGHTAAWGFGYPQLTVHCNQFVEGASSILERAINVMAMNPIADYTFEFLDNLFSEMSQLFEDSVVHLGGDEVQPPCWLSDPTIVQYMKANNIPNAAALQAAFTARMLPIAKKYWKTIVLWEEAFAAGARDPNIVVAVWNNETLLQTAAAAGQQVIQSWGAYLDRQNPTGADEHWMYFDTWTDMYTMQLPANFPPVVVKQMYGAEASSWGENVDAWNTDERLFHRLPAIAERMWSASSVSDVPNARVRMAELRCKLVRRGFSGGPVMPDYCDVGSEAPAVAQPGLPGAAVAAIVILSLLVVGFGGGFFWAFMRLRRVNRDAKYSAFGPN